ncbi:MAG: hypothetical protein M3Y80_07690, partial [Verrucomicrobiota bacterium]|nr:hypothetical protein [Verrucomicrobiota bacterium]
MASDGIPITQKLLVTAGGWPVMKQAQQMQAAGRVLEAEYNPPVLSGMVREGARNLRSGLRIKSQTDVENLCTCRESREWGKICAHALAVGVQYLAPAPAAAPAAAATIAAPARTVTGPTFVELGATTAPAIALHFILPPNFESAWAKQQLMLVTEVELDGKRVTPTGLSPNETYACDTHDLAVLDLLRVPAPMQMFSRAEFLRLLRSLQGHPRITFGRSGKVEVAPAPQRPRLSLARSEDDRVTLRIITAPGERLLGAGEKMWRLRGSCFERLAESLPPDLQPLADGPLTFRGERALRFLAFEAQQLREWFEV